MKQSFFHKIMAKLVARLDPRWDKYRAKTIADNEKIKAEHRAKYQQQLEQAVKMEHDNYIPQNEKELVQIIRRTPRDILSVKNRNLISGAMSFDKRTAMLVTMPREDITFLNDSDFLGPLNLDKLYKTGDTVFPVLNKSKKVCGLIRTNKLDLLHITKDQPVTKLMEHEVAFARTDYTLEQLLAVFLRTHTDYVLIIDDKEELVGYAELSTLIAVLFNREIKDDFADDSSSTLVSRRDLK
jgi:CBS domain containing-hemolysin-like protein